ncbi:hypothetical protein ACUIAK_20105 [Bacillus cytotoxicus]
MHQKLRMRNHPIELLYINFTKIKDHLYPLLTTLIATLGINGKWERFAYYGFAIFCKLYPVEIIFDLEK